MLKKKSVSPLNKSNVTHTLREKRNISKNYEKKVKIKIKKSADRNHAKENKRKTEENLMKKIKKNKISK